MQVGILVYFCADRVCDVMVGCIRYVLHVVWVILKWCVVNYIVVYSVCASTCAVVVSGNTSIRVGLDSSYNTVRGLATRGLKVEKLSGGYNCLVNIVVVALQLKIRMSAFLHK